MLADGIEDEIVFRENGSDGSRLRVLRGTILKEGPDFLTLQRRDGTWSIRISLIERIVRRSG